MPTKCPSCVEIKPEPNKYTTCKTCGYWRPMNPKELEKVSKRAPKNEQ